MGLAGLALTGCDEAPEAAIPQHNPQGPVFEIGSVDSTPTSYLSPDKTLDLSALSDQGVERIPLVNIGLSADLIPAGSSLEAILEISKEENPFVNAYSIAMPVEIEQSNANNINGVAYVEVAQLETAMESLFGMAPKDVTLYYQIPVTMTLDGTNYRLGGFNTYYAQGPLTVAYAPSFFIDSAYYIIGDVNGWNKENVWGFKFENPSADVYANPVFTQYVTFGENSYWKIVPQSTMDDPNDIWAGLMYGPKPNGNIDLSGALYSDKGSDIGAGCIVDEGRYLFSINMMESTYTITPIGYFMYYGIYVRGGQNGWNYPAIDGFFSTETAGVLLDPAIYLPAGTGFKIADATWNQYNLGLASAGSIVYGAPNKLVSNGADMTSTDKFVGYAVLTKTEEGYDLTMNQYEAATAGESSGIFVRGGMNGWGAEPAWEFKTTQYKNIYVIDNATVDAGTEFKVADADWASINLGQGGEPMALNVAYPMNQDGGNLVLNEAFNGTIVLVYNEEMNHYFLYYLTPDAVIVP